MKKVNAIKSKVCYACGDIYGGGSFFLIGVLYLNFLTDIVKITPALAGSIFLVGKIWDAISDPLMGMLSDRTRSKYGRRRVYFLVGIIPIFLSFAMLWVSINTESQIALFGYYLISYIFFSTVATMVMIPYNSILPEMTSDYKERTSYITIRLMFSNLSAVASGVLPMIIINSFGNNIKLGYAVMGIVFAVFYAVPYIFVFLGTFENEDIIPDEKFEKITISHFVNELKATLINRSFRTYSGFFIAGQTAVDFVVTIFIYYLTYCLGMKDQFSIVLGVLLLVQILSMPIHMKLSNKFGKTAPLKIGLPIWVVALLISLTINASSSSMFIYIIAILTGFGCSASIFVPWSIFPELADIDELITGKRREGVYSGMSTLIRKIAQAVTLFLIGVLLDVIGYVPNVSQKSSTILGLKLIFAVGPIIFIVIALYFATKYKMTEDKYETLKNEVDRRKNNMGASEDINTIKVCEELTGIKYDELELK